MLKSDVVASGDSFDDIQDAIDKVDEGSTVFLDGGTYKSNSKEIKINKSITIDGSGSGKDKAILDAKYLSRIFYVDGEHNVILKNLIFENVSVTDGGVVHQDKGNLTVNNIIIRNLDVTIVNKTEGYIIKLGNITKFELSDMEFYNNNIKYNNTLISIISSNVINSTFISRINYHHNVFRYVGDITTDSVKSQPYLFINFNQVINLSLNQLNIHENNFNYYVLYPMITYGVIKNGIVNINGINYTKNNISHISGGTSLITVPSLYVSFTNNISNVFYSYNRIIHDYAYRQGVVFNIYGGTLNIDNFNYFNNYLYSKLKSSYPAPRPIIDVSYLSENSTIKNSNFKNNDFYNCAEICFLKCNINEINNLTIENNRFFSGAKPYGYGILAQIKGDNFLYKNIRIANNFQQFIGNISASILDFGPFPFILITGNGTLYNWTFVNNVFNTGIGISIQPGEISQIIIDSCYLFNNSATASLNTSGRDNFYDHGAAMCINGKFDNASSIVRNCVFINNTNSQGGALTPHNHCIVENCTFINNTATKFYGGAISTEDGFERNNANVTIRDCYFENNAAPIGGAIQGKGDYLLIDNCTFKDNYAVQGGAVFLEGENLTIINSRFYDNNATHDNLNSRGIVTGQTYLPQITEWRARGGAVYIQGVNARLNNNTFCYNSAIHGQNILMEGKGGAIYIQGNKSSIVACYFDDNFAHSGNGSAVYILGINSTFNKCEFYNHDSSRGTVFIHGSFASVLNSIFKANTASRGGAGIYSIGNYSIVSNSTFENNNASIHGGAIHTHGDYIKILNSIFIRNNAHPNDYDPTHGIGGAIYIRGNFNDVAFCDFEYNTARNGSAIYNHGNNFTIEDSNFHLNQAFSYLLVVMASPETSNYTRNNKIILNVTHIGGDNIINAIHNDGDCKNIFFYNVTYEHSSMSGGKLNTGLNIINPVNGVENSNGGRLLYQDPREDLQFIKLTVARERDANDLLSATINGDIIKEFSGRTGLYGNITFELLGDLKPGKYNVYAEHPEDWLYKQIENITSFTILPQVDVSIEKTSDKDSYLVGEIATYTITLNSLGSEAHNVVVREILPIAHKIIDYKASKGKFENNIWSIPVLGRGATETLVLRVLLTSNGTFTNSVNVTTSDNETNLTNNYANRTIIVKHFIDLMLTKTANIKVVKVGDTVTWTITVKNIGSLTATGVKVSDLLPESLKYLSHVVSKGSFDVNSGVWDIGDLSSGESVTLQITTKVLTIGKITNHAVVSCNEEETDMTNNMDNATIVAKNDPENNKSNRTNKGSDKNHTKSYAVSDYNSKHETGNPLVLLLLALVIIPIRRFKF
ncbi:MAG: DUF11 domain-containing protein [Methanobrevibacter sp.]|nr:DUF11 domain-containing protein [Methanobrevibacter sp.]